MEKEAVAKTAFYSGETGRLLRMHACTDCWREWIAMQIMIINEYRLDLMSPQADAFLNSQVLAFFRLGQEGTAPAAVQHTPESPE
jgi:Fe-S cluster biosynthesis and repair protein YggX